MSPHRSPALAALVLAATCELVAASAAADARPARAILAWEAALEACLPVADLEPRVEALLDRDVIVHTDAEADVRVVGTLESIDGTSRVSLTLRAADGRVLGRRTIERPAAQCEDLRDAVAIVLSLLVDLGTDDIRIELPPPPRPPASIVPAPPIELSAALAAVATWGAVPDVGAGAALSVGVRPLPWLTTRVSWQVLAPTERTVDGRGVRLWATGASVSACGRGAIDDVLWMAGCAGVGFTTLVADSIGLVDGATASATTLGTLPLDLVLGARWGAFELALSVSPGLPIGSARFSRDAGSVRVYETAPVWVSASLEAGVVIAP